MKKRVLSMMLCLCMVLMMAPAAFAQDGVVPGITGPALGSANVLEEGA